MVSLAKQGFPNWPEGTKKDKTKEFGDIVIFKR